MTEINNQQNLEAHYSKIAKTNKRAKEAIMAPDNLPKHHLFNDADANKRMKRLNQDIYTSYQAEKKRNSINFIKVFGCIVLAILACLGLKKVFKKS